MFFIGTQCIIWRVHKDIVNKNAYIFITSLRVHQVGLIIHWHWVISICFHLWLSIN